MVNSLSIAHAGLQHALIQLNKGLSPDVTDKAFGGGLFKGNH